MVHTSPSEPVVYTSLALKALCQRLQDIASCDILELGPVRNGNIEFWSQLSPSIYIADLRSSLPLPPMPDDPDYPGPDWHQLLDLPKGRCFDVILAWDMLNYLELPAVSGLIQYLSGFCRPGTIVFMMIFDSQKMPEEITIYGIVDESHVKYEFGSGEMRVCPRHQPHALAKIMGRFRTSNSFRLRNGVIEYLFVYEG
jgi:hypothetical protein